MDSQLTAGRPLFEARKSMLGRCLHTVFCELSTSPLWCRQTGTCQLDIHWIALAFAQVNHCRNRANGFRQQGREGKLSEHAWPNLAECDRIASNCPNRPIDVCMANARVVGVFTDNPGFRWKPPVHWQCKPQ